MIEFGRCSRRLKPGPDHASNLDKIQQSRNQPEAHQNPSWGHHDGRSVQSPANTPDNDAPNHGYIQTWPGQVVFGCEQERACTHRHKRTCQTATRALDFIDLLPHAQDHSIKRCGVVHKTKKPHSHQKEPGYCTCYRYRPFHTHRCNTSPCGHA